ncbi:diguanylate cyclase (GGDEF) domain-containing protein [Lachnospiraceae bacterium]|nr:diguanylate cyclase (GGDEF) domain-containing protein [Lachnospiraceae bacterium]
MNFLRRLTPKRYYEYKDEVDKRNVIASETFILVGFIVAAVNLLSNMFVAKTNGYVQSVILLLYFVFAALIRSFVLRDGIKNSLLFLYTIQIPVMVFGILMGTYWDPDSLTITFFLLLICLPPFILDNPVRHLLYIVFSMAIYLIMGLIFKNPEIFRIDVVHALSFLMGSIFLNLFVLAERYDNIENYMKSQYKAMHDELSGLKNRYALKLDVDNYVNKDIYAGIIDIDYFKFYNDMYGHGFGEELVSYLGNIVTEIFGENICYRYESDELLVMYNTRKGQEFTDKISELKNRFNDVTIMDMRFHPSFSVGYVFGKTISPDDVSEIIRHAEVRLLEAKNEGRGAVVGFSYDRSEKRRTDILKEIGININKGSVDSLTGLTNMQFFRIRADEMLGNVIRMEDKPIFLYFNIGNFKAYNETYGFRKGDALLKDIADILKEEFDRGLISRFAEDHFVILDFKDGVEEKLDTILSKVKPLFSSIEMNLKAGIYEYEEGEEIGIASDKAKLACDSIKHTFGKNYVYYEASLENHNKLQQYVISHVAEAAEKGYLRVYYQPIVNIDNGQLFELEALARWVDPIYGFLSPGEFIPVLEESRLIHIVDRYIIDQACRDQKELSEKAGRDIPVSINLSRLDFMLTDIVGYIKDKVKEYGIDEKTLHIEITESALVDDKDELVKKIDELKTAGFEVWLDDFGSGYSSLNSLQDFSFDVIKVDMRFMRTLSDKPQTAVIVTSIIDMVKNLGVKSLVEGVETEEQYDFLHNIGTDMAQGFLFSKPVPKEELEFNK